MSLFGDGRATATAAPFDERVAIPDVEFDKTPAAGLREGDARPLRERPPADGRRGAAAPPDRLHASPSCGTPSRRRDARRRRRGHRPPAQVHQEGRPHGHLRPRGPRRPPSRSWSSPDDAEHGHKLADDAVVCVKGRLDTRDDQPKLDLHGDHAGRARRRRRPAGARSTCPPPSLTEPGGRRAEAAARRAPGRLAGVPPRGRDRCCACPPSSASTPPTAWSASSGCCSATDAIVA